MAELNHAGIYMDILTVLLRNEGEMDQETLTGALTACWCQRNILDHYSENAPHPEGKALILLFNLYSNCQLVMSLGSN